MKKTVCLMLALVLCLTAFSAFANSVPSKNTGDLVDVEIVIPGSSNPEDIVIEIVDVIDPADENVPADIQEKRKAAVEASNAELQKLVSAISAIPVPTVPEGAELTDEQKKDVAIAQTKAIEEYFGGLNVNGENKSLTEVLGAETATVDEFFPMVVSGLEKDCGAAVMNLSVANVYTSADKVIVLIGLVAEDGSIVWQTVETTVTADGKLKVELPEGVLLAMQENTCVVSVARGQ